MALLQEKVAIITGASKGIGRALALCFAGAGASVVCAARSTDLLHETVTLVEKAGGRAQPSPVMRRLSPEHAEVFQRGVFSKARLKREIWERSKMSASRLSSKELERARASRSAELGDVTATTLLPIAPRPEDIQVLVAGGPGTHSVYMPCFGNSRAVTRAIAWDDEG